jgi:hypothetical protein
MCGRHRGAALAGMQGTRVVFHDVTGDSMDNQLLVRRVQSEFLEMPGLQLTPAQAARLWDMDSIICQEIIDCLVGRDFLRWTPGGALVRVEQ